MIDEPDEEIAQVELFFDLQAFRSKAVYVFDNGNETFYKFYFPVCLNKSPSQREWNAH